MSKGTQGMRHPKLYFPDGDIVLSAVQSATNTLVYFRVDIVYLRRSSAVLRDLLSLPSCPEANETYDGVLLVHTSGDRAEDLAQLLLALYDVSYV